MTTAWTEKDVKGAKYSKTDWNANGGRLRVLERAAQVRFGPFVGPIKRHERTWHEGDNERPMSRCGKETCVGRRDFERKTRADRASDRANRTRRRQR